jgi:hypothetical protein
MKEADRQQRSNTLAQTHLLLLLVVLMVAVSVGAQTSTTGDIAGVVTDPTAAVVSGVPITLRNVSNHTTSPSQTQMRTAAGSDKSHTRSVSQQRFTDPV